ncbi:TonB-dependent receptor [Seonamhaeicola sp.]|uniref:SusC/RagA family TonB-linked outer membrane protein n=1 Tax=Seonamhaeicola sp. TaxID=1912245 RepID=UPI0026250B5A|nr:TonB-dependent receptor [Seonamhaeicola sp.]
MKINLLERTLFKEWQFKAFLIAFICSISMNTAFGQTQTIKGQVSDIDGEPLVGATVIVTGTSTGAVTDFDGNYEIKATAGSKLQFSYLGYIDKVITVGSNTTINVTLDEDLATLDEVVVVGYGTQKKKEVTGAVGQIKAETLVQNATADLGNALQGQIAGVSVTAQDGEPGAESNIVIRGVSSLTGTTSPLYVVDGIPFDEDPRLSIEEIESIDVLKDAASAAIYGTRGAGGVILITTKKTKPGVMKISLNSWYGIQRITSGTPLLDTEQWIYARNISEQNNPTPTWWDNTWTRLRNGVGRATNNSSQVDLVEQDQQPIQNHSLNIAGGKEGLTYNLTAAFFSQDGAIINTGHERFNLRANSQFKSGKWNVQTGLAFRLEERNRPAYQLLYQAFRNLPYQDQVDLDADTVEQAGNINDTEANQVSQQLTRLRQTDTDQIDNFQANMTARYDITKNLSYSLRGGISLTNNTRKQVTPQFDVTDQDGNIVPRFQRSGITNTSGRISRWTVENILNYKKSFGSHNFVLTAVYSAQSTKRTNFFATRLDLRNNDLLTLDNTTADPDAGNGSIWLNNTQSLTGILGRLQYNYKGKYLFSASIRRDGSSQFGINNVYGNFPSATIGWNVSDEAFWAPLKRTVTSFKTRASIGTVGNDRFQPYSDEAVIVPELDYTFGPTEANRLVLGAIQTGFANQNVKWETTVSKNIGFDLGLFKNKLTITGDFYQTDKEDLLLPLLIPPSTGAGGNGQVILNVGDMTNKGMEWAVNYKHRGKLSWNVAATYTQNRNKVTKMSGTNKLLYLANSQPYRFGPTTDEVKVIAEGYEAGSFFLIKTDGIIRTQEELDEYSQLTTGSTPQLGDTRLVDANGDGVINVDDQVYAGSAVPDFEAGLNFNANYKGFDFAMQWYGTYGAEIINGNKAFTYSQGVHRDRVYQWSPQNPTSNIPLYQGSNHNNVRGRNDTWLEDGSFARLKNITFGYSIPKKYLEPHNITKIRVYLSGQNLITLTDYTGYDPEVGGTGISTSGLDRGAYPFTSAFRLGVQLSF